MYISSDNFSCLVTKAEKKEQALAFCCRSWWLDSLTMMLFDNVL